MAFYRCNGSSSLADGLHFVGNQKISGSCSSGGWVRTVNISTSQTLLQISLPGFTNMTINSASNCTATFQNEVLTITSAGRASGTKDDYDSDYADAHASFIISYDITIT